MRHRGHLTIINGSSPDRAPAFAFALLFWTAWQLLILSLVALGSVERERPREEMTSVAWPATVHVGGNMLPGSVTSVSLSELLVTITAGDVAGLEGRTAYLEIPSIGRIEGSLLKHEPSCRSIRMALRLVDPPVAGD